MQVDSVIVHLGITITTLIVGKALRIG